MVNELGGCGGPMASGDDEIRVALHGQNVISGAASVSELECHGNGREYQCDC